MCDVALKSRSKGMISVVDLASEKNDTAVLACVVYAQHCDSC